MSNNFDVKSNEELFKQALVEGVNRRIDKTIGIEKQIEEMAQFMAEISHLECGKKPCEECKWLGRGNDEADCTDYLIAEALYNAGYRKQSEGEWQIAVDPVEATFICSKCGYFYIEADPQAKTEYKYCPHCGSKMKGGEQGA